MKRVGFLVFGLLFLASLGFGQSISVRPVICSKTVSTAFEEQGNDTVWSKAEEFDSVAVGDQIYGPGFKLGVTVTAVVSTDTIVVSDTCLTTQDSVSFQIEIGRGTPYSSGDWLGFPFKIFNAANTSTTVKLVSVEIIDDADQIGNTDILFFSGGSGDAGLDNAALAVPATDESYLLGYVALTTTTDLGAVKMATKDDINLLLPRGGEIWGRLVARSTPSLTATNNIRVKLRFQ